MESMSLNTVSCVSINNNPSKYRAESQNPVRRKDTKIDFVMASFCKLMVISAILVMGFVHSFTTTTNYARQHRLFGISTFNVQQPHTSRCILNALDDNKGQGGGMGTGGPLGRNDLYSEPEPESEETKALNEQRAEARLPASFRTDDGSRDAEFAIPEPTMEEEIEEVEEPVVTNPLALLAPPKTNYFTILNPSKKANSYRTTVESLTPSDLISRFMSTAPPRVQEACRTTILGLIGQLPKMEFQSTVVTSGERLANLMFQLQMTGYMFKNAEYQLSLSQFDKLEGRAEEVGWELPPGVEEVVMRLSMLEGDYGEDAIEDVNVLDPSSTEVSGTIKVRYPSMPSLTPSNNNSNESSTAEDGGMEVEVDAAAYLSELRSQVANLRSDLAMTRETRDSAVQRDLLAYIRTLPPTEMSSLTGSMSAGILEGMEELVAVVMRDMGGDGNKDGIVIGPDTMTEQSVEALAQLCMWQLVTGYNLRELEVREEMGAKLLKGGDESVTEVVLKLDSKKSTDDDDNDTRSGIYYESDGFQ